MSEVQISLPLGFDDREAFALERNLSPNMLNVRTHRERIDRAPGLSAWKTKPSTPGTPRRYFQGWTSAGGAALTERIMMFTDTKVFASVDDSSTAWPTTLQTISSIGTERWSVVNTQDIIAWTDFTGEIKQWNGSAVSQMISTGTNHSAKQLLAFNDRIISIHTHEGGQTFPTRIRWSVNGNVNDWSGTGAGTLEALEITNDPLTGGFILGERAYLTKAREIIELIATGDATSAFTQETVISNTGMPFRNSFAEAEYFGFFLGPDQVYTWDGSSLKAIGQGIWKTIAAMLDHTDPEEVQGVVLKTQSEYWLLIDPDATGGVFIYDYQRNRWHVDDYNNIKALGVFEASGGIIDTDYNQSDIVVVGVSDADTLLSNIAEDQIDGSNMDSLVETPDYPCLRSRYTGSSVSQVPTMGVWNTLCRVKFQGTASAVVEVGASVNSGGSWSTTSVTVGSQGIGVADFWLPYTKIRFRLRSNADAAFSIKPVLVYEYEDAGVQL